MEIEIEMEMEMGEAREPPSCDCHGMRVFEVLLERSHIAGKKNIRANTGILYFIHLFI